MPPEPERRFPRPWRAEKVGESYRVVDAGGFALVHFYFEDSADRRRETKRLTSDDARRLATNFAKLPDLLDLAKRVGLNL